MSHSQHAEQKRPQLALFEREGERDFNPTSYDRYVIALSGGKDSVAAILHLLDLGIDRDKMELWHHKVDGDEGDELMDWPVTPAYCEAVAEALGIDIFMSWKVGGFEGEMLRENEKTAAMRFEVPDGDVRETGGNNGSKSTRRMFPQVSGNLQVRWCSSYLKMDVASAALRNQKRFERGRTLFITGERAEESPKRRKMDPLEPHDADLRNGSTKTRWIDHWRPMLRWPEEDVWEIMEKHRINPHPAYRLGWGRCSCQFCIFGSDDQFASAWEVSPERARKIAEYEEEFGTTIKRDRSVREMAERGESYDMDEGAVEVAMSKDFEEPVILEEEEWEMPQGAFGDMAGPS